MNLSSLAMHATEFAHLGLVAVLLVSGAGR